LAREAFDRKAKELHDAAHPLMRAKFPAPELIPYYYLFRERAVALALAMSSETDTERRAAAPSGTGSETSATASSVLIETTLKSRDGLLVGRPDYVDPAVGEVVDYKTGVGPDDDPHGLRDSEVRQLRLYVHLGRERGLDLRRGTIIRVDGRRAGLEIPEDEAAAEGKQAREMLGAFNARAAGGFKQLAAPSAEACRYCPCIPFCEPFWESAVPAWAEQCGTHLEGTVTTVNQAVAQNTRLVTLELAAARGTVGPGAAVVQQLPEKWICVGGGSVPKVGDVVRVVNGRLADTASETALIRPDRLTTAVWIVRTASIAPTDPEDRGGDG